MEKSKTYRYNDVMKTNTFTIDDVEEIAKLALIPVTDVEKKDLAAGFTTVIGVLAQLDTIDVSGVEPTHQVTGLENIFREDEIEVLRIFTQEEALANAPRSYNGFFVVDQILDQE